MEEGTPDDEDRAELMDARAQFRDPYSEAHSYGISKRPEIGKLWMVSGGGTESIAMAEHSAHVIVNNCIIHMRHLMRRDLGVSGSYR